MSLSMQWVEDVKIERSEERRKREWVRVLFILFKEGADFPLTEMPGQAHCSKETIHCSMAHASTLRRAETPQLESKRISVSFWLPATHTTYLRLAFFSPQICLLTPYLFQQLRPTDCKNVHLSQWCVRMCHGLMMCRIHVFC